MKNYYLYNLYKNLNLYNNFNLNLVSKQILNGGGKYYSSVFLELFQNIKNDLETHKQTDKININEIAIKMRTYYVLLEVYNSYLNQLIQDQQYAKRKILDANDLSQHPNINGIQHHINSINTLFDTLLGTTASAPIPASAPVLFLAATKYPGSF